MDTNQVLSQISAKVDYIEFFNFKEEVYKRLQEIENKDLYNYVDLVNQIDELKKEIALLKLKVSINNK